MSRATFACQAEVRLRHVRALRRARTHLQRKPIFSSSSNRSLAPGPASNGRLPAPYKDFCEYGIDRDAVAPAIRECVALGFLEVTERGWGGNAEFRAPNLFRLTYVTAPGPPPTNEWKKIGTLNEALAIARQARLVQRKQKTDRGKPHVSCTQGRRNTRSDRRR
jgi:hypothetical protein